MIEKEVNKLHPREMNKAIHLQTDLAAEFPLYIFLPDSKEFLLYSFSIRSLLEDDRVEKPLNILSDGVSFLMQSGVIPPPRTIYSNIYILGIGDEAKVATDGKKIVLDFGHDFPFRHADRLPPEAMKPDEDKILELVGKAVSDSLDSSRRTYLFHSAGKDSNTVALAIAEAGWQDKVTLVTHKSPNEKDESAISSQIAQRLGFSHCILKTTDKPSADEKNSVGRYFHAAPFPSMDKVTIAYPLYARCVPELQWANILDGMGNDVFIGHIPSLHEYNGQKRSLLFRQGRAIAKYYRSESIWHSATRSRAEWCGLGGFSRSDANKMYPGSVEVHSYWQRQDRYPDYLDLRAVIRGRSIDQEVFMRKVRNFADVFDSNVVFPFANELVARYFSRIPEENLFDRKTLRNKIILRKMLNNRIGLDSDAIGKKGFSYDYSALMKENWRWFLGEIRSCRLWDKKGLEQVLRRLEGVVARGDRRAFMAEHLIYRLYLISAWFNHNKYINCGK